MMTRQNTWIIGLLVALSTVVVDSHSFAQVEYPMGCIHCTDALCCNEEGCAPCSWNCAGYQAHIPVHYRIPLPAQSRGWYATIPPPMVLCYTTYDCIPTDTLCPNVPSLGWMCGVDAQSGMPAYAPNCVENGECPSGGA